MQKIFLDTNILIDFLDDTRKNHLIAQKIFQYCLENERELGTSEDVMTTVYYIAKKNIPQKNILKFFQYFSHIGSFEFFGEFVRKDSIEYCLTNKNSDLEDVLQAFCAQHNKYDAIVSNDKSFVSDIIPVYDSKEIHHIHD